MELSQDDVRKNVAILTDGSLPITRMEFQNLREDINEKFIIINTSFAEAKAQVYSLSHKFDEMNGKLSVVLDERTARQVALEKKEGKRWDVKKIVFGVGGSVATGVVLYYILDFIRLAKPYP